MLKILLLLAEKVVIGSQSNLKSWQRVYFAMRSQSLLSFAAANILSFRRSMWQE